MQRHVTEITARLESGRDATEGDSHEVSPGILTL